MWIPILILQPTMSHMKKLFVENALQVFEENIKFEHIVLAFNLIKKDPATKRALKTKLYFKSFEKYLRQIVCAFCNFDFQEIFHVI